MQVNGRELNVMCRAAHEIGGPRRCPGCSSPAKARRRQRLSRARRALKAAEASGNQSAITAARAKLHVIEQDIRAAKSGTASTPATAGPVAVATTTERTPASAPVATSPAQDPQLTTEQRIHAAVRELATRPRGFVSITKVRELLGDDLDQDDVTQTMVDMASRGEGVHLSPDSNRRGLTQADHDAAVKTTKLGGYNHLIAIEPPDDAAPTTTEARIEAADRGAPSAADIAARLRDTATKEEGAEYLAGQQLNREELRAVASELGMTRLGSLSDKKLQERVLNQAISARDRFAGLREGWQDQRPLPVVAEPPADTAPVPTEQRVRDTVRELADHPGGLVSLTELRRALPDIDRADLDRAVTSLADRGDANLIREINQKSLTDDDRAAALQYGPAAQHLIRVTDDLSRPDSSRTTAPVAEPAGAFAGELQMPASPVPAKPSPHAGSGAGAGESRELSAAASVAARLRETATEEQGAALLKEQQLDREGLLAVADELGITRGISRLSVKKLQERVLNQAIGARDKAAGLREGWQQHTAPTTSTTPKPKPVSGIASDKPLKGNGWGGLSDPNQHYFHDDGPLGTAMKYMGNEQQMSVDGEPLANVVGDIATDVARRRCSAQEGVDRVKALRDRLPDWSKARGELDNAIRQMDGPATSAPTLPAGTPEPLQTLTRKLHAVPIARQDPSQELDPVTSLAAEAVRDDLSGFELRDRLYEIRNRRHESFGDCGKFEIDDAIEEAMKDLRKWR
uniref:hypothetical protein n=1 Tax=Amycolatopsis sp. CA-082387 TaxID=3239918 RepID=UPI003F4979FE